KFQRRVLNKEEVGLLGDSSRLPAAFARVAESRRRCTLSIPASTARGRKLGVSLARVENFATPKAYLVGYAARYGDTCGNSLNGRLHAPGLDGQKLLFNAPTSDGCQ
ncbi:unnamed protein product, partial [Discosporangium mesarthrocarpum]